MTNTSASETLAAGELSNAHVISCHAMWVTCLLVSLFWKGSGSLMEARDGSLESVSKTLSIRQHLFLECTVPLNLKAFSMPQLALVLKIIIMVNSSRVFKPHTCIDRRCLT